MSWRIQSTPTAGSYSALYGVSCSSAHACIAVGTYTPGNPGTAFMRALVERWNGRKWTLERTPKQGGPNADLVGAWCRSASACTAVGAYEAHDGTNRTLAERWNGRKWTIERTPNPPGSVSAGLNGISCTSASTCTAVGTWRPGGPVGDRTLAEHWNGTKWTIEPTPNATNPPDDGLISVSCVSGSACIAAGVSSSTSGIEGTLAERWNGEQWAIMPTPNSTDFPNSRLDGVSCAKASACTAVGSSFEGSSAGGVLAERWDGTKWTIQPAPNPQPGTGGQLYSVSCPSTSRCTGVGGYFGNAGHLRTLAERWTDGSL